jgi:hypothetical protein
MREHSNPWAKFRPKATVVPGTHTPVMDTAAIVRALKDAKVPKVPKVPSTAHSVTVRYFFLMASRFLFKSAVVLLG